MSSQLKNSIHIPNKFIHIPEFIAGAILELRGRGRTGKIIFCSLQVLPSNNVLRVVFVRSVFASTLAGHLPVSYLGCVHSFDLCRLCVHVNSDDPVRSMHITQVTSLTTDKLHLYLMSAELEEFARWISGLDSFLVDYSRS